MNIKIIIFEKDFFFILFFLSSDDHLKIFYRLLNHEKKNMFGGQFWSVVSEAVLLLYL